MFNVNTIYYNVLASMTSAIGVNWNLVKGTAEGFLADYLDYLNALALAVEQGFITPADALEQVKKVPDLLKANLMTFEIIGEGLIQTAANNALDVLVAAIGAIVPKVPATPSA